MTLPSILVNARFTHAPFTGVQRYAREVVGCLDTPLRLAAPHPAAGSVRGHLWEQFILPRRILPGEILLSPANTGPLSVHNQVVILHDLAALDHPEWFDSRFAAGYRLLLPRLARSAQQIITVSSHSQRRIQARLNIPPEKISVVSPGVSATFHPTSLQSTSAVRRKLGLGERYLLWVGTLEPRKNLPRLLLAWQSAAARRPDTQLALVGVSRSNFRNIRLELPPGVIFTGSVDEADLPPLYSGAIGLILPSLEEGFGLPILEAMACGTPVIASRTTGASEILGAAMLTFDPLQVSEISAAIEILMADAKLRRELSELGISKAAEFTWPLAASRISAILQMTARKIAAAAL